MQKQQNNSDEKRKDKKFLIANLIRKKREVTATTLLTQLTAKVQQLDVGLKHNQFGSFCSSANMLDKAEEHFNKAIASVEKYFPFSNVYMNLGNLYAQKRQYEKAIKYYEQVIEKSPYNEKFVDNQDNLPSYSAKLNSYDAFVDAHTNIAVMLVQLDKVEQGLKYCQKALELKPGNYEAQVNFTDFLRQVGKKDQAIKHTWDQIMQLTKKNTNPDYEGFKPIEIKSWTVDMKKKQDEPKQINILSVKWGTRYNAAYVNKLYLGIKRNTSWKITFYCFTQDPKDLHPDIKPMKLEEGWTKWWGKVTLFGQQIPGRKFYIDLDMVITGNMDQLFGYQGQFATLRTDDLVCEKYHKGGYNSSVMIWQGDILKPVYQALKDNFQNISKFIVRFDFWLQMTIANADFIQVVYPGKVVDYLGQAKQRPPEKSCVVCFARKPKPEDYPSQWIKEYWVE